MDRISFLKKHWPLVFAAMLLLMAFLLYAGVIHAPFVFDDEIYVKKFLPIRSWSLFFGVFDQMSHATRCVTFLTFAINYWLHGLNVEGYHITNILIHAANAWGVLLLLSEMGRAFVDKENPKAVATYPWAYWAATVSVLFLVHPVQTQAVTYITQRFASLAAFFYIYSVYFFLRSHHLSGLKMNWLIGAVVFAGLGMLSKENVYTLPLVWCLCEWGLYPTQKHWFRKKKFLLIVILLLSVLPIILWQMLPRIWAADRVSLSYPGDTLNVWTYFLTQCHVLLVYLKLIVWPVQQNLLYDFPAARTLMSWPVMFGFALYLSMWGSAALLWRRQRLLSLSLLWFLVTMLMESSVIPVPHVIFEHRLYLPMLGLLMFIVYLLLNVPKYYCYKAVGIVLLVVSWSWLTIKRNQLWADPVKLWANVVQQSPTQVRAKFNLATALASQGRYAQALLIFDRLIEQFPQYAEAYSNKALAHESLGQYEQAQRALETAIDLANADVAVFHNLSNLYLVQKKIDRARKLNDLVLAKQANYLPAWLIKIALLVMEGQDDEAMRWVEKLLEADPKQSVAYRWRGDLRQRQGFLHDAVKDYQQAMRMNPNDYVTLSHLGYLLYRMGDDRSALAYAERIIQAVPDWHYGFALKAEIIESRGKIAEAIQTYSQLIFLDETNPLWRVKRARHYARQKNYQQGLEDMRFVVQSHPDVAEWHLNRGMMAQHLALWDEALDSFNQAITLNPAYVKAYNNRAVVWNQKQDWQKALADLNQALIYDPDFVEGYYNRGHIQWQLGALAPARQDMVKVLSMQPGFRDAKQVLEKIKLQEQQVVTP